MASEPPHRRYRLKASTIAVVVEDGKEALVHIPAGAEILALDNLAIDPMDCNRQVSIEWNHQRFKMFVVDVQERGEPA